LANDVDLAHIVPIDPDTLDIIPAVQGSVLLKSDLFFVFFVIRFVDRASFLLWRFNSTSLWFILIFV
jgi:hypothetical protein